MSMAITNRRQRVGAGWLHGGWVGAAVMLLEAAWAGVPALDHLGLLAAYSAAFSLLGLFFALIGLLRLPLLLADSAPSAWWFPPVAWVLLLVTAAVQPAVTRSLLDPPGPAGEGPELVLVTLDTTRADRYWAVAEEFDGGRLEAGAARFRRVWSPVGLTAPAHASLFTGELPSVHGLINNGGRLAARRPIAARLREAGYRTLGATSVIHLDPSFGFGAGFDRVAACEGGLRGRLRPARELLLPKVALRLAGVGRPARPGQQTLARALELWQDAGPDRPRFLWIHLFDPHWPYTPAGGPMASPSWPEVLLPGYEQAAIASHRSAYDGEIRDTRRRLADALEGLRADSQARGRELVVAVVGDHGEALGEHGASGHGDLPYEEGMRVPLWVDGAGIAAGDWEVPLSLVQVGPGLVDWLTGTEDPRTAPFVAALQGQELPGAGIRLETAHGSFRNVAWIEGGRKWIAHRRITAEAMMEKPLAAASLPDALPWWEPFELYDLFADPQEQENLYPGLSAAEKQAAEERLAGFLAAQRGPIGGAQDVPPEIQDALRELGYLGAD